MSTHEYHEDPEQLQRSIEARYELRDGDYWAVGKYINGFFIFTGVCFAIAFGAMLLIHQTLTAAQHPITEIVMNEPKNMPKYAPLQNNITASKDMVELRARERAMTQAYGKVDGSSDKAHIPVDRAIEELGSKGIAGVTGPSAPSAPTPAPGGTTP